MCSNPKIKHKPTTRRKKRVFISREKTCWAAMLTMARHSWLVKKRQEKKHPRAFSGRAVRAKLQKRKGLQSDREPKPSGGNWDSKVAWLGTRAGNGGRDRLKPKPQGNPLRKGNVVVPQENEMRKRDRAFSVGRLEKNDGGRKTFFTTSTEKKKKASPKPSASWGPKKEEWKAWTNRQPPESPIRSGGTKKKGGRGRKEATVRSFEIKKWSMLRM